MKTRLLFIPVLLTGLAFFSCISENTRWNNTKLENTITAYELFLQKYADGEFADSASFLLEELYFKNAKSIDSINVYENFLIKYPEGPYADSAHLFIKLIDYKIADSLNTVEAFEEFINKYPGDSLAEKSKLIIDNFWIVTDIDYSIVNSIEAYCGISKTTIKAKAGHIITLHGNFSVAANSNKKALLSDIKLSGRYKDDLKGMNWESEVLAYGLNGTGSCSFYDNSCLITGEMTITVDAGYGIGFKRMKSGTPGEFSIIGNTVPICLAFRVPEIPDDFLYLTFEYRDFPIKLNAEE